MRNFESDENADIRCEQIFILDSICEEFQQISAVQELFLINSISLKLIRSKWALLSLWKLDFGQMESVSKIQ